MCAISPADSTATRLVQAEPSTRGRVEIPDPQNPDLRMHTFWYSSESHQIRIHNYSNFTTYPNFDRPTFLRTLLFWFMAYLHQGVFSKSSPFEGPSGWVEIGSICHLSLRCVNFFSSSIVLSMCSLDPVSDFLSFVS